MAQQHKRETVRETGYGFDSHSRKFNIKYFFSSSSGLAMPPEFGGKY